MYTNKQKTDSFYRFADAIEIDCNQNPELAAVQSEMVQQGWAVLCFETLAVESLKGLHLSCLHLLLALTGGGNIVVQDLIYADLMNEQLNLSNVFSDGFQVLLFKSIKDLKALRKKNDEDVMQRGYAQQTLSVLTNLSKAHKGMQDYTREQTGKMERHDLLTDIVAYMAQLERDLKVFVKADGVEDTSSTEVPMPVSPHKGRSMEFSNPVFDEEPRLPEHHAQSNDDRQGTAVVGSGVILDRAVAGLQALRTLVSGPHKENQILIASSDFLSVVNRIMLYTEYECVQDVDEGGSVLQTAKGVLNSNVSFALLALVEGIPDRTVVQRLIGGIEWSSIHRHLNVLKTLIGEGHIGRNEDDQARVKKNAYDPTIVPNYVADTNSGVQAEWLRREAFRFFSFLYKVKCGGELLTEAESGGADPLAPLRAVLRDAEMLEFFDARVGQAEVVRNGALENLFFWSDMLFFASSPALSRANHPPCGYVGIPIISTALMIQV
eukprot:SAG11_NODE_32_length_22830_cov_17.507941_18_plen_493_part_00